MREIVEVRVHGVGGPNARALLEVSGDEDLGQVAGNSITSFQVRRGQSRRVEGYIWGRLTSRSFLQPLWLLLLPFTMVNVAGWMHPPLRSLRKGFGWANSLFRLGIRLIGVALTATYVFWTANLVLNRVLIDDPTADPSARRIRITISLAVLAFFVVGVFWVARKVQRRFEAVPGSYSPEKKPISVTRSIEAIGISIGWREQLSDTNFWYRPRTADGLLIVHLLFAIGAMAFAASTAFVNADERHLRLWQFPVQATRWALWGLVAVGVLQLVGWRLSRRDPRSFRWLGPMTAATTGFGLATGFFYGLNLWLLGKEPGAEELPLPADAVSLGTAFGGSAAVGAAFGVGMLGWLLLRARKERRRAEDQSAPESVPAEGSVPAREPTGATPWMYTQIGLHRAFSEGGRNVDLLLTATQFSFIGLSLFQLERGAPLTGIPFDSLATIGNWIAAAAAGWVLTFLLRRSFRPSERITVGTLWDVLTFWPRRFHPLAVRPYAERAVPELQHRLNRHLDTPNRGAILSTHSQGSVIGYAALVQAPDEVLNRIAFVTYGSPLRQLYGMAFPGYFGTEDFDSLKRRLFNDHGSPHPGWRNFYRCTDYVGKAVFRESTCVPGGPNDNDPDVVVPDPPAGPLVDDQPLGVPIQDWPEPPLTAWIQLLRHSGYNRDVILRNWLTSLRVRMQ